MGAGCETDSEKIRDDLYHHTQHCLGQQKSPTKIRKKLSRYIS